MKPMVPLAFLVLAHDDPDHLRRLCRMLSPHPVYVHLDAKAGSVERFTNGLPANARLIDQRFPVWWAGFEMVEATLALIRQAMQNGGANHTVLLSGHCYPIKPIAALADMLAQEPDTDHIQLVPIQPGSTLVNMIGRHWRQRPFVPESWRNRCRYLARADDFLRRVRNRLARAVGRRFSNEIAPAVPYQGSQWWALTHATLVRVCDFIDANPVLARAYRTTFAPDEMFFHTVFGVVGDQRRQKGSTRDRGHRTLYDAPLHLVADTPGRWTADSPQFREEIAVVPRYFVRKIGAKNAALLDWIDHDLLRVTGRGAA